MSATARLKGARTAVRRRIPRTVLVVTLAWCLTALAAFGYWTAPTASGGNGYGAATSVNQGSTPVAVVSGRSVTLSWAASSLASGTPVFGYTVQRYNASTQVLQTIGAGCTGTLTATTCTETLVPAGTWVYTVAPRLAGSWTGPESPRSATVVVASPVLSLAESAVRPGTVLTGTGSGFLPGDTVRIRLDSGTGTELTGTFNGASTPATVPASGSGAVSVTLPAGVSDGDRTIVLVGSSGELGSVTVTVDGTAPAAPSLTSGPGATSGDSGSFSWSVNDSTASVECRIDGVAYDVCDNPETFSGLAAGSHTFQIRATDPVGNVSAVTTYTWNVDTGLPTVAIAWPTTGSTLNDNGFNQGCGTATTGDLCGTAEDDVLVLSVSVSLRQDSTGKWWNGSSLSSTTEVFLAATGTTSWNYAIAAAALPEGSYTLRARASDVVNMSYASATFTIDRTAPSAPVFAPAPAAVTAASATVGFTSTDPSATFECNLDSGGFSACVSPRALTGLASGAHSFAVRALDPAGNLSTVSSANWTVDTAAPTAVVQFPGAGAYSPANWAAGCGSGGAICGTAADTGAAGLSDVAVSVRRVGTNSYWNGTSFADATETWLTATGTTSWRYAFTAASFPADGSYVVRARSRDAVGNTGIVSASFSIDSLAPPTPSITHAPANPSSAGVQFEFADAESGVSFECTVDAAAWTACASPGVYSALPDGPHSFAVRAVDSAGNRSSAATYNWTVDGGLPVVGITSLTSGSSLSEAGYLAGCGTPAADICGTAADPGGSVASVQVSILRNSTNLFWNGTAFTSASQVLLTASGTTVWSFAMASANLPDGTYTITARVTDGVGHTVDDTVVVTFDRVAPAAPSIVSGPSGTTTGADSLVFTGESGATFRCQLDTGTTTTCTSPVALSGLADGAHTVKVYAVDAAGNISPAATRSWTVDATGPVIATTFPTAGARLASASYAAGCSTTAEDPCGVTSDATGVSKVQIAVLRDSTGLYYTGSAFSATTPTWITVTGTTSWTYGLAFSRYLSVNSDGLTLMVRATDTLGNVSTANTAYVIDKVKPTATALSTTNISTVRKLEAGDTYTLTWSEAMNPAKFVAGWDGTGTQNVVVRVTNSSTTNGDRLIVYDATNTTTVPLGTLYTKRTDYVSASMTFGATGTPSKLTFNGTSVTITLGTASSATSATIAAAAATMTWTPSSGAADLAGNTSATTSYAETDSDSDF